jgi:hypothetical protein
MLDHDLEHFAKLAPSVLSNALKLADALATGKGIKFYFESLRDLGESEAAWRERETRELREFAGSADLDWWCDLLGVTPHGRRRYAAFLLAVLDGRERYKPANRSHRREKQEELPAVNSRQPWTPAENAMVLELHGRGMTAKQIGRAMGRTEHAVWYHMNQMKQEKVA